jgi:hypothetical protein
MSCAAYRTSSFGWNLASGKLEFSRETFRILAFDPEQPAPSFEAAMERVHPEDRAAIWKQWKRGPARFVELRRRDVSADLAAQTAGTDHGPWRLADSPALTLALPNAYFDSLGVPRLTVKLIA